MFVKKCQSFLRLQCNQVGLTENIRGDKKKFELWLRAREEVYIVQVSAFNSP